MLSWGVFLLAAGGVMLLAQAGVLDRGLVGQALGLWPLLLVAIGAKLILRRTSLAVPAAVVAALVPGLLLGGVVVAAPSATPGCHVREPGSYVTRQGSFDGSAEAILSVTCGDLEVTTAQGSQWQARAGETGGPAPIIDFDGTRLYVASKVRTTPFVGAAPGDLLKVILPTGSLIDLAADIDAGRGRFDLAGARLGRVQVDVNAGEATVDLTGATLTRLSMELNAAGGTIRLPSGSDFTGELTVNAGKLVVCAPPDLGLRVRESVTLGSSDMNGLVRTGGGLETPSYALAPHHADLAITVNVGSVEINPEGGCK